VLVTAPKEYRSQIAEEWTQYWKTQRQIPEWDFMSQIVYESLRHHIPDPNILSVCEVGCGTGRISLRLAREGAFVSAIDVVPEAVTMTKNLFASNQQQVQVKEGSIFSIPFDDEVFDVTWNAGVLEHFSVEERRLALAEMARVTKPKGRVITLNPNSRSLTYRIGKFFAELFGRWPYGHEDPVKSLRPVKSDSLEFDREYTTGVFIVLLEVFRIGALSEPITFWLRKTFLRLYRSRLGWALRRPDRLLSALTGGYLLVSVFTKRKK
jgi:2-polyprenyl-3-methyl-5-hydroxy-6-metoxy-1,4-benzoquinol methylase